MQGRTRFSLGYYLVVFAIIFAVDSLLFSGHAAEEVPYSTFLDRIDRDEVEKAVITQDKIYGYMKEPGDAAKKSAATAAKALEPPAVHTPWRLDLGALRDWFRGTEEKLKSYRERQKRERERHFTVTPLDDPGLIAALQRHGVDFRGKIESKWLSNLFLNWILPFGVLILVWGYFMRKMGKGPAALNMGRSQPKIYEADPENRVRFADVAGIGEAIEEVKEVVSFLEKPDDFTRLGAKLPKGVLLVGPPGTGKTLLARAIAGEAAVPFFSMSGSDFVEMFVGVGAARVRDLFAAAKEKAPCIIFIDELDAIGKSRASQGAAMGGYDERENTLNQLLVEMDGFDARSGVVLVAATNRPEVLDKALLRPGRFDRQVLVGRPYREGRAAIFRVHAAALPLADDVDVEKLAAQTPGFVGADIANLCNEAALLASRRGGDRVSMADFQDAVERVIGGLEKKGRVLSEHDRRTVAYHESGHALVGWFTAGADPVQKISIVPRGQGALGYTLQAPLEDRLLVSTHDLLGRIRVLLGGRAAEQLVFGEISTGASDDLEKASQLGRDMLAVYGMSERLPNLSLVASGTAGGFLGQGPQLAAHSEETAQAIDRELVEILRAAYDDDKKLLDERREQLEALASRLLEREKLEQSDLMEILGPRPGGSAMPAPPF